MNMTISQTDFEYGCYSRPYLSKGRKRTGSFWYWI